MLYILISLILVVAISYFGMRLFTKLEDHRSDKRAELRKAVEIYDDDQFIHGQRTDIGNAFVYGTISATDPVRVSWASEDLMLWQIEVKEWAKHVQTTTTYEIDAQGNRKPHTKETVYYTWDTVYTDGDHTDEVIFKGQVYPFAKVGFPYLESYGTIYKGSDLKEERYALPVEMTGTLYTTLADDTISYGSQFMQNVEPAEARERMIKGMKLFGNMMNFTILSFLFMIVLVIVLYLGIYIKYML